MEHAVKILLSNSKVTHSVNNFIAIQKTQGHTEVISKTPVF